MADRGLTFVDTNVLVYAHDRSDAHKHLIAQGVLEDLWQRRSGSLSTQVLQEFYVVATRKFDPPMRGSEAREVVALYGEWDLIEVDVALILSASKLGERHQISFWDALIVEAAGRSGAARLLTEDLQHGRRIAGITVANPFV
ncbi:MAG: PIN domain-containing protein [Actinomycetota bacterium]|nr:PIN domain-containing protein [Actinomycetota bacterium]